MSVSGNGYVYVHDHTHPKADERGRVYEHIVVAEQALGKLLPASAIVHHVDGTRSNNAKGNLVICEDQEYHMLLHRRQRALAACGDAEKFRCRHCGCWDDKVNLKVFQMRKHNGAPNGWQAYHRTCHATAARKVG